MDMEPGKLFIGGISWDTNEDRLREYFETFGEVVEAVIMKDRTTGRARGFGFVIFANASVAEKVVRERHIIDGRTVEAKKAVPRDDNQISNRSNSSVQGSPVPARTRKIFVGGLASNVTESDFKTYFDQFGTITDVVVMYDHNTQRPRGFGFITYDSEESVDRVLFKNFHELNGKMVEVKRAVPKEISSGPTRSLSFNHGLTRVSSFLNAYNSSPIGGGYGMKMEGRFSPITVDRNYGYTPSSYSNLDSGFGSYYGASGRGSFYSGNLNRYSSPIGFDLSSGGNGSFLNQTNQNVWGNVGANYGSNPFNGSGNRNSGPIDDVGGLREIWGSSPAPGENLGYVSRASNYGGYGRNIGGNPGAISSFTVANNVRDVNLRDFNGIDSFYSNPDFEVSALFGHGRGGVDADVALDNSVGYVGGYSVNASANRGIAA